MTSGGSVTAKSQLVIAEVVEVVMCAAGFVPGHAAQAAVDGLALEDGASRLDFGDDVASCELGCAGALMELANGVEDGVSAAWTGSPQTPSELRFA
jgi:hypothetical protein